MDEPAIAHADVFMAGEATSALAQRAAGGAYSAESDRRFRLKVTGESGAVTGENAGQRCTSFLHRAIVVSQFIFHRGLGLRCQCSVHEVDTKSVDFVVPFAPAARLRIDSLPSR